LKQFKTLLAMVLALTLALSLSTAFAAAQNVGGGEGSVSVTTNWNGQTYTLYKLFDAEITLNAAGDAIAAINYKLPAGKDLTGNAYFEVDTNGNVVAKSGVVNEWAKEEAARTWARSFGTQIGTPITAASNNDPDVSWTNIPYGYYYVDSTLGAFITVNTTNPDVEIADKNNPPSLDKSITGVKDENNATDGSIFDATETAETTDPGDGSNEHAIAQVGDTITYSIVIVAKPGAQNYVLTDTMDNGLTPPAATGVSVMVGETDLKALTAGDGKAATVSVSEQTITVNFAQAYLDTITADTTITVTYTATLNDQAVVATDSNDNTATLTWGHDNNSNYTTDDSKVWTAKIGVNKKIGSDTGSPLQGAGFVLRKQGTHEYYHLKADGTVEWVTLADDEAAVQAAKGSTIDEHISIANGTVPAFSGLPNGTYELVESTVPDGYNKTTIDPIEIEEDDVTADNLAQTSTVVNNAGAVLPTTGGIGTTIFYIAGIVMVLGAAAIVIARRKAEQN